MVSFMPGRGAPGKIVMDSLYDWTRSSVEGVRFYSGTALYSNTFILPDSTADSGKPVWLDLGEVREIAVVRINGSVADTLWKRPYAVEVSNLVKSGDNLLEVEVTNLWHNRLVGDAGKEGAGRVTRTNIQNRYRRDMPLISSGLIGPVSVHR
jgi:hypothetical protein